MSLAQTSIIMNASSSVRRNVLILCVFVLVVTAMTIVQAGSHKPPPPPTPVRHIKLVMKDMDCASSETVVVNWVENNNDDPTHVHHKFTYNGHPHGQHPHPCNDSKGNKVSSHITQQVDFATSAKLKEFLDTAGAR